MVVWDSGFIFFFFQAEDGIRDLVRSRGLGDVYKRQRYDAAGNHRFMTSTTIGETPRRVAIIGGGVTGLTVAYDLTLSLIHI